MTPKDPSTLSPQNAAAQDPLAELQDIHLPAEIGLWPPAWGWWLLAIIIIASVSALIFFINRKKSRNAYRALALSELNNTQSKYNEEQNSEYLQAVSIILRRTALSGFGSQFNASLKGREWLEWLDDQCPKTKHQFSQGVGTALLIGPYQKSPEFNRNELQALSVLWVKEHRNQWQKSRKQKNKKEEKISEVATHV
ncbi:MAG: DUF4381 domain-containing protein [Gammaproteobacteria bacterium]|nr:MAG: DUF4381 domain-containing protein [Gammaproteobacteria bacterium]